jgi:hypothetical protein
MRIIIETETPDESQTIFRILLDAKVVGDGLTAVQSQLVAAEIIERPVLPKQKPSLRVVSPAGV